MDQDQAVDGVLPLLLALSLLLLLLALLLARRLSARAGVSRRWRRSVELADGAEELKAMLAVKAAASARLGTFKVPLFPFPLLLLLLLLLELVLLLALFAAAAPKDSLMLLSGGHKFVVCTSPRSKWKHSSTAAPTLLRRATIALTTLHLFRRGS